MLTVAVPILNRPHLISRTLEAFSTEGYVLFLPNEDDHESIETLHELGANYSFAPAAEAFGVPTYASKVNHAYRVTKSRFIMYASDDIIPQPGWYWRVVRSFDSPNVGLVGLYDGLRPHSAHLRNATHGIVRREYVEKYGGASLPDAGPIFWEGYRHACVDVEVTGVARSRGAYLYQPEARLKNMRDLSDATTALGESFLEEDRARMRTRRHRWGA